MLSEETALQNLCWAERKIADCLNRPMLHLADPTVGERRAKLVRAIDLASEVDTLVNDAGYGLKGQGYVLHVSLALRESLFDLRQELK